MKLKMKQIFTFFCVLVSGFTLTAQTTIPEAINVVLDKNTLKSNSYVDFIDKSKQITLPEDGMFLYSSLNNKGVFTNGYDSNENYVVTISNPSGQKIRIRTEYVILADRGDVLSFYDGPDTLHPLMARYDNILLNNELIVSHSDKITISFKSNSGDVNKGFRLRVDQANLKGYALASPNACLNATPAADACVNAPLICNLNGYCGNTSGQYTADNTNIPGFCGSIENNSWLSFIASSTTAQFQFTSAGCQDNSSGIQALIYASSNCSNFTQVSNCVSQGTSSGSFTITTSTALVPGVKYYIMVDGYAGNVCSYSVTAQSGVATNPQITANPTQICPGSSTQLGSSIASSSYTWTASDGSVLPNTATVSVSPTVTTTYTLDVGPSGCSPTGGSAVQTITVSSTLPPPNVSAPNGGCGGNIVTLSSLTNGGTFAWTGPNGFTSSAQNPTIPNFNASNAGTYSLTISYGPGCATQEATVVVNVLPSPNIAIAVSPSNATCPGGQITLTASGGSGAMPYNWSWVPSQTSIVLQTCITTNPLTCINNPLLALFGGAAGPKAVITPNANTQVCATTTGANGCSATACQTIIVLSNSNLNVSPSVTTCPSQPVTLSGSGTSSYTWTGSGITSSANNSTVSVNPSATEIYTVTGNGCGATVLTNTVEVVVTNMPPVIGAIQTLTTVCPNQTDVHFTVTNLAGTSYSWTLPPGAVITSTSSTSADITANIGSATGTFTAAVTATNTCGSTTETVAIQVNQITVNASASPTSFCSPGSTTLTTSGAYWYDIQPTNGLSTSSGTMTTFVASPTVTTSYTITGNTGACINNTVVTINVGTGSSVLNVSSPASICPGNTVALTATGSTGTYTWSPSTAISGSVNNASVTANPSTTTIYTVSAPGCTGVATNTVQVTVGNSVPVYTVNANLTTICLGQSAVLTATANGVSTYSWSTGSTTNPLTVTPTVTTTYTVTDNTACPGQGTITITVNPTPALTVGSSMSVCPGGSVNISAAGGGGTYTWTPSSAIIGTTTSATVAASPASTTVYTVTAPGCLGLTTSTVQVTVLNPLPVIVSNPTVICSGGSSTLTATGANTYSWAGSNLSTTNGSVTVASPGSTSTYTVTGFIGVCSNTAAITVAVTTPPVYMVTANATSICAGQSAVLTATANGVTSYSWNTGSTQNPLTVSPSGTTSYTVTGNSLCPGQGIITITVNQLPSVSINSALICAGQTATLSAGGTASSYTWTAGNGSSLPHTSTVVVSPSSTTSYTLTGSNAAGCLASNTTTVSVSDPHASFSGMPNATETIETVLNLQNTSTGASNVAWLTCYGISTSSAVTLPLNDEGTCCVTLYAYEGSCVDSVTQCVNVVPKARLIVPNVFTPNGDGRNDNFTLDAVGIGDITIAIFDRWGLKMFETSTTGNIKWDGKTKNGALVTDGTYFYMLKATGLDGGSYDLKGTINVFQ
jgi:gliding motility-associated-like protein